MEMLKSDETVAGREPEIVPSDYFASLDLLRIYGRRAPLEVDLGCGDGLFLAAKAEANPDRDFLGIERLVGRVRRVVRRIQNGALANARVLRVESLYAVQQLLPPASVEVFHLLFPDPWPKRRHWRRRLVTEDFLAAIHRALVPEGTFRIATDQLDYFRKIECVISRSPGFIGIEDREPDAPLTTFEKRFRQCDAEIYRIVLRKVSPSRNEAAPQ